MGLKYQVALLKKKYYIVSENNSKKYIKEPLYVITSSLYFTNKIVF